MVTARLPKNKSGFGVTTASVRAMTGEGVIVGGDSVEVASERAPTPAKREARSLERLAAAADSEEDLLTAAAVRDAGFSPLKWPFTQQNVFHMSPLQVAACPRVGRRRVSGTRKRVEDFIVIFGVRMESL